MTTSKQLMRHLKGDCTRNRTPCCGAFRRRSDGVPNGCYLSAVTYGLVE